MIFPDKLSNEVVKHQNSETVIRCSFPQKLLRFFSLSFQYFPITLHQFSAWRPSIKMMLAMLMDLWQKKETCSVYARTAFTFRFLRLVKLQQSGYEINQKKINYNRNKTKKNGTAMVQKEIKLGNLCAC